MFNRELTPNLVTTRPRSCNPSPELSTGDGFAIREKGVLRGAILSIIAESRNGWPISLSYSLRQPLANALYVRAVITDKGDEQTGLAEIIGEGM